ncbi:MAG TPA: polysaccharide biosynthesis/export family protein, partial [Flavobacterium sp.]
MKFLLRNYFIFSIACITLFSCGSKKEYVYLQNIESQQAYEKSKVYEPTLQPDDMLSIMVTAASSEVTIPFNLPEISGSDNENVRMKTYLIDNNGYINYPVLGRLKLGGLTRTEADALMISRLSEYITNPGINIRIINYKFSVLGEVVKPNVYTVQHERVTLLEALSMAGDIGIYGIRRN